MSIAEVSTLCHELERQAHPHSPEVLMAVKNLQTAGLCVAKIHGVRVSGTGCNDSMQGTGSPRAPFLAPASRSFGAGTGASTRFARTADRTDLSTRSTSTGINHDSP